MGQIDVFGSNLLTEFRRIGGDVEIQGEQPEMGVMYEIKE